MGWPNRYSGSKSLTAAHREMHYNRSRRCKSTPGMEPVSKLNQNFDTINAFFDNKIYNFQGELTNIPAKKASLPLTVKCITMEATDVSPTLAWSQFPFPMSLSHEKRPLIATAIAIHPHSHPSHLVVVKLAYVTPSVTHRHRALTCTPVSLFAPKHRLGQSPAKLFSKLNWSFVWGYFDPVNMFVR